MKSKYLFSAWYAWLGYLMAIPGLILGYLNRINGYQIPKFGLKLREKGSLIQGTFENFTNELVILLVIMGLLLIAFSKVRDEDERMAKIRLNSLYWSVITYYITYNVVVLVTLVREIPFLSEHLLEINLFTPLLIFVVRFTYLCYLKSNEFIIKKPKLLANQPFKIVGLVLAVLGSAILIFAIYKEGILFSSGFLLELGYFAAVTGLLILSFSKNKIEDEMTMQQRLESLQLAVYFNYAMLLLATFLFYSFSYLLMMMFAQFSLLLFYLARMEFVNYKNNRLQKIEGELNHEK